MSLHLSAQQSTVSPLLYPIVIITVTVTTTGVLSPVTDGLPLRCEISTNKCYYYSQFVCYYPHFIDEASEAQAW